MTLDDWLVCVICFCVSFTVALLTSRFSGRGK